jgi:hypothetical protein
MSSGVWIVCSDCGLRHSVRQDARCPRCGGVSGVPAPGEAWRPHPAAGSSSSGNVGTLVKRLLGGALILALVLMAARYLKRGNSEPAAAGTGLPSDALPPRPPEPQRALAEPPLATTPTPTYLQKAFSDVPRSRPAHPRPR